MVGGEAGGNDFISKENNIKRCGTQIWWLLLFSRRVCVSWVTDASIHSKQQQLAKLPKENKR